MERSSEKAQRFVAPKKRSEETVQLHPDEQPEVSFAPELTNGTEPYTLEFNNNLFGQLLVEYGIPPEEVSKFSIDFQLSFKGDEKDYSGDYDRFKRKIRIFTKPCWNKYITALNTARKIANGEIESKDGVFNELLTTRRLSRYLEEAPHERGIEFASKLLQKGVSRATTKVALHEAGHSIDHLTKRDKLLIIGSVANGLVINALAQSIAYGEVYMQAALTHNEFSYLTSLPSTFLMVNLFGIFAQICMQYTVSCNEFSAKSFANLVVSDPRYREIIKLTVKEDREKIEYIE